ncbi:unnamed protein product [Protopolystoma xenopodis]|uniref:Uncharacterized protein n=1 Tax=Protopolystoma xenopodis TaxID=117903 RepID=A0A448WSY3_9PLAT|nr:unnamed protein product [Protopolystoma xenopodis]
MPSDARDAERRQGHERDDNCCLKLPLPFPPSSLSSQQAVMSQLCPNHPDPDSVALEWARRIRHRTPAPQLACSLLQKTDPQHHHHHHNQQQQKCLDDLPPVAEAATSPRSRPTDLPPPKSSMLDKPDRRRGSSVSSVRPQQQQRRQRHRRPAPALLQPAAIQADLTPVGQTIRTSVDAVVAEEDQTAPTRRPAGPAGLLSDAGDRRAGGNLGDDQRDSGLDESISLVTTSRGSDDGPVGQTRLEMAPSGRTDSLVRPTPVPTDPATVPSSRQSGGTEDAEECATKPVGPMTTATAAFVALTRPARHDFVGGRSEEAETTAFGQTSQTKQLLNPALSEEESDEPRTEASLVNPRTLIKLTPRAQATHYTGQNRFKGAEIKLGESLPDTRPTPLALPSPPTAP